jgi:hypothetical protein
VLLQLANVRDYDFDARRRRAHDGTRAGGDPRTGHLMTTLTVPALTRPDHEGLEATDDE